MQLQIDSRAVMGSRKVDRWLDSQSTTYSIDYTSYYTLTCIDANTNNARIYINRSTMLCHTSTMMMYVYMIRTNKFINLSISSVYAINK